MSAEGALNVKSRPVGYARVGHTQRQQCGAERSFTRWLPVARAGQKGEIRQQLSSGRTLTKLSPNARAHRRAEQR